MLQILKQNWKLCLVLTMLVALAFAICVAGHYYNKAKAPVEVAKAKQILLHPEVPITDTFTDKSGQKHAEIAADKNTIPQQVLNDTGINRVAIVKQVTEALNLSDATHILEVTQENIQLKAQILKMKRDSANSALLVYRDPWLSFKYDPRDSTVSNLGYIFKFTTVRYKKPGLFHSGQLMDFYADDRRVNITGVNHFTVEVPQQFLGITADARGTYDFYSGKIIPSVGLDVRAGKFFVQGRNYWSAGNQRFQQSLSAGYRQTIY